MKKEQLARELARESRISKAAAADQVDRIVTDILKKIRSGQAASLPGLGTFRPGLERDIKFDGDLGEATEAKVKARVRKGSR